MEKMKKIYLAIPYSGFEQESFDMANQVSAMLMKMGYIVFSPISHTHPMVNTPAGKLPSNWEYWKNFDETFIKDWADEVWVFCLNYVSCGFDLINKSKGVQGEIEIAKSCGKPIKYINMYSIFDGPDPIHDSYSFTSGILSHPWEKIPNLNEEKNKAINIAIEGQNGSGHNALGRMIYCYLMDKDFNITLNGEDFHKSSISDKHINITTKQIKRNG